MTASRICFAGILLAALSIKMAEVCQIFTPAEVSLRLYKIAARADE
jgi:hypothetical protein